MSGEVFVTSVVPNPRLSTLGEVEIPVPEVMAIFSGFPSDHPT